jgi:hypothetical protein
MALVAKGRGGGPGRAAAAPSGRAAVGAGPRKRPARKRRTRHRHHLFPIKNQMMVRNNREKVKKDQRRARIEFPASLSPLSFFAAKCPSLLQPEMARIGHSPPLTKTLQFGLIRFDSLGFTLTAAASRTGAKRNQSPIQHRLPPESGAPIPAKNSLIWLDLVGLNKSDPPPRTAAKQFQSPIQNQVPPDPRLSISAENGWIYFDSVGFTPIEPSRCNRFRICGFVILVSSFVISPLRSRQFALIYFDSVNAQRGSAPWIVAERSMHGGRSLKFTLKCATSAGGDHSPFRSPRSSGLSFLKKAFLYYGNAKNPAGQVLPSETFHESHASRRAVTHQPP